MGEPLTEEDEDVRELSDREDEDDFEDDFEDEFEDDFEDDFEDMTCEFEQLIFCNLMNYQKMQLQFRYLLIKPYTFISYLLKKLTVVWSPFKGNKIINPSCSHDSA